MQEFRYAFIISNFNFFMKFLWVSIDFKINFAANFWYPCFQNRVLYIAEIMKYCKLTIIYLSC